MNNMLLKRGRTCSASFHTTYYNTTTVHYKTWFIKHCGSFAIINISFFLMERFDYNTN